MSRLSLKRKLLPANKAWKTITRSLLSQINKLKNSNFIRTVISRTMLAIRSFHLSLPLKRARRCRSLIPSTSLPCSHNVYYGSIYHHQKNYAPIYIDELFDGQDRANLKPHGSVTNAKGESSRTNKGEVDESRRDEGGDKMLDDIDQRWRAIVAKSPQLRCVDKRAEEFINRFKEDMKLERERSILEFQEMLRRST